MPQRRIILLVDNSPARLGTQAGLFADLPYRIVTATDGEGAIRTALVERPDLIVLDDKMPGLSGLDALERIRASEELRSIPVILLAEAADEATLERAMEAGLTDTLRRPFHGEQLLRKVARALGLSERKSVSFLVRLTRGDEAWFVKAMDLSATGMAIELQETLRLGDRVTLQFFLPGSRNRLKVGAAVIRRLRPGTASAEPGYGLRFTDLAPGIGEEIEKALKDR